MKPSLLILAAGIGRRYGGLKQIDPVGPGGEILIDYAMYDALRAGFGDLVFVIQRQFEDEFRAFIEHRVAERVPVSYAYQELEPLPGGRRPPAEREKPWGTGHAVLAARDHIEAPFAVINADDFYGRRSFESMHRFLEARDPEAGEYGMVGFRLRNTLSPHGAVARGVCDVGTDGYLREVVERTRIEERGGVIGFENGDSGFQPLPGDSIVSMNLWGFTPAIFPELESGFRTFLREKGDDPRAEFYLPSVVDRLVRSGRATVKVLPSEARWFGVTYREDHAAAVREVRERVRAGEYPERLWSGA